jgi:Zn-dependent protease
LPNIDVNQALQFIVILLISIDFHELAHGYVADHLGDPTPRQNGQLSLNPFVHMDQFGVILLVITSIIGYPFTWGRTFIQPANLKYGPQRGGAIVAAAGPLTNLGLAIILGLLARVAIPILTQQTPFGACTSGVLNLGPGLHISGVGAITFLEWACWINLILFAFNLLPIPPLDGFSIVAGFLTPRQLYALAPYRQYAPLILVFLFLIPGSNLLPSSFPNPLQIIVFNPALNLLHVLIPQPC